MGKRDQRLDARPNCVNRPVSGLKVIFRDKFPDSDGACAGKRQGNVPSDVRRSGIDGGPDPAAHHIGQAKQPPRTKLEAGPNGHLRRSVSKSGISESASHASCYKVLYLLNKWLSDRIMSRILQEARTN